MEQLGLWLDAGVRIHDHHGNFNKGWKIQPVSGKAKLRRWRTGDTWERVYLHHFGGRKSFNSS